MASRSASGLLRTGIEMEGEEEEGGHQTSEEGDEEADGEEVSLCKIFERRATCTWMLSAVSVDLVSDAL